jgi:UDPglucose 6-dehydrogenase
MRATVIGAGYLGAVHAACMAELGHEVVAVDTNTDRVRLLAQGIAPFYEPGFDELLDRHVRSGRLRFGATLAEAAAFGRAHFICVGTPQSPGSQAADLSAVRVVIRGLGPHLRDGSLIIGKSTVPVGTAQDLLDELAELAPAGAEPEVAWNPEFLREGYAVKDTLEPDRVVVGVTSDRADRILREIYAPVISAGTPYIRTDLSTAELVKVSANAFLATKISFINAMADLCETMGADVVTLADALGYDARIGRRGMSAGLGFGGGCLPKDLRALIARSEELGVTAPVPFLRQVDAINSRRRSLVIEIARDLVGGTLRDARVGILGAAFKPNTDDIRDSPALAVAVALHDAGAQVLVHDPQALGNASQAAPQLEYAPDAEKACTGADILLHLTEWGEYRDLDPVALRSVVRHPILIDARNALPLDQWSSAGWRVRGLGVRASAE